MIYYNLISTVIKILAENGETRTLTLVKLTNQKSNSIKVQEPMVFERRIKKGKTRSIPFSIHNEIEGEKNLTIDWGDGTVSNNRKYRYTKKGRYRIKIYNYGGYEVNIQKIHRWADDIIIFISIGRINLTNLSQMFEHTLFNGILSPNWDTSKITNMSSMFYGTDLFNRRFGQNWDTGEVVSMKNMFAHAKSFDQPFGKNWDTSKVTNFSNMFYQARKFNQPFGQNWNIKNAKSMRSMFESATSFEKSLIKWDIPQNTDVGLMFWRTKK